MRSNLTSRYLYAFYSNFGGSFVSFFNDVKKGNLYLADRMYQNFNDFKDFSSFIESDLIFVTMLKDIGFERNISLIQSHVNYICDYPMIDDDEYQVVVFKVVGEHKKALEEFKRGNFSKMYNKHDVDKLFSLSKNWYIKYRFKGEEININENNYKLKGIPFIYNNIIVSYYHVLSKSEGLRKMLNLFYKVDINTDAELHQPIKLEDEVLNYYTLDESISENLINEASE